jgi:hypothetical protein
VKKTQERQETQETHVANFYIPLFSFTLRKETNENEKNLKTQERQETQETQKTPVISWWLVGQEPRAPDTIHL